MTAEVLG